MNVQPVGGGLATAGPRPDTKSTSQAPPPEAKPAFHHFSPIVHYDPEARVAIVEFLDSHTGEVTRQIPSERVVEQYRQRQNAFQVETERPATEADAEEAPIVRASGTESGGDDGETVEPASREGREAAPASRPTSAPRTTVA